jgi:adenylosuccinate lyase
MTASADRYSSPLADRYASRAMIALWSPQKRHGLWRRLWVALAESERELGIDIPLDAIEQMRANVDNIDFDAAAKYERRFRHDVMAHVHTFADVAPAARKFIHLGATSAFVTDNADLIQMREGMVMLRAQAVRILSLLSQFAREYRGLPTLGYTHLQPAQLTTVGKRATLWMQDLVLDVAELDHRIYTLPFRGVKGTTGTQASFLELFDGDHDKVRRLDDLVTDKMQFPASIPVSGQTYTRKIDAQVLACVAGMAATAAKFSSDVRMLQAFGEIEEPFETEQIGSSAMAYKRNPMRSERIAGLARFVIGLESNANYTHSTQYFERTLDDSANRRLTIPESFLATDAILILMANVSGGLKVHPAVIASRLSEQLPMMATEAIIVAAVRRGRDRQAVHEIIRRHSMDAVAAMRTGQPNDLIKRLSDDSELGIPAAELQQLADPMRFVGRAPEQVDDFLSDIVDPIVRTTTPSAIESEEVTV